MPTILLQPSIQKVLHRIIPTPHLPGDRRERTKVTVLVNSEHTLCDFTGFSYKPEV